MRKIEQWTHKRWTKTTDESANALRWYPFIPTHWHSDSKFLCDPFRVAGCALVKGQEIVLYSIDVEVALHEAAHVLFDAEHSTEGFMAAERSLGDRTYAPFDDEVMRIYGQLEHGTPFEQVKAIVQVCPLPCTVRLWPLLDSFEPL